VQIAWIREYARTHVHAKKWTAWPWHSEAPSVIEAADWTVTTTITDITITKRRHPLVTHGDGYTTENGMRDRVANGDGFLNLAIKDPSWLNARAPHIESDLTRPRVFVGRPLSSSKFNYRYQREIYFCAVPTLPVSYHNLTSAFLLLQEKGGW